MLRQVYEGSGTGENMGKHGGRDWGEEDKMKRFCDAGRGEEGLKEDVWGGEGGAEGVDEATSTPAAHF